MSKEYDAILSMLEFEDLKRVESDDSSILRLTVPRCCYTVSPHDITFWIYEFEALEQLKKSIDELKKRPPLKAQLIEIAQNGLFLLVVRFKKSDEMLEDLADIIYCRHSQDMM